MKNITKFFISIRGNVFWGLVVISAILIHQLIFQYYKSIELNFYSLEKLIIGFFFYFLFSFTKSNVVRFFLSTFILILAFIQMVHLSYFGTQILPNEIWLLL